MRLRQTKQKQENAHTDRNATTYLPQGRDGTRWTAAHPHKALAEPLCYHPWTFHCLGHRPRSYCAPHLRLLVRRLPWPFQAEVTNLAMHFLAGPPDSPFVKDFSYARSSFGHRWLLPNASNLTPAVLREENESFLLPVTPFQNRITARTMFNCGALCIDYVQPRW